MPGNNILALDIGEKRVGVALVRAEVRVPVALDTLDRQANDFWQQLAAVIEEHDIQEVVMGLPRGLDGQETAQTKYVQSFAQEFSSHFPQPIHFQDEALTSVQSENILGASGKPYQKADVDALAASLILSDYLETEKVA